MRHPVIQTQGQCNQGCDDIVLVRSVVRAAVPVCAVIAIVSAIVSLPLICGCRRRDCYHGAVIIIADVAGEHTMAKSGSHDCGERV
jgi:hypothetical protein